MRTEYKTKESQESAIRGIEGCIKALNEVEGLPYKIGSVTFDYITKYLSEYKKIIEKDMRGD